jgi:transposase-like protein
MNEMMPKPNNLTSEEAAAPVEVELNPQRYVVVTELAPSQPDIEALSSALQNELTAAVDYGEAMDVLAGAVSKNGHQTVLTALLTVFNREPSDENKYYLRLVEGMAEMATIPSQESLKDPDFEGMESLLEVVSRYTQEDIAVVANITTPAEAFASPERKRMRDDGPKFTN